MKIKKVLVSQPKPASEKSPYYDIAEKYGVRIGKCLFRWGTDYYASLFEVYFVHLTYKFIIFAQLAFAALVFAGQI